jgi:hypothetical protein
MGGVDAAGDDVLNLAESDTDALTRALHRHAKQVIDPDMRQRTAIPGKRGANTAQHKRVSHRRLLKIQPGRPPTPGCSDKTTYARPSAHAATYHDWR